ncbi:MAG: dephospho-CoA kinase [Bacteroidales bacterium]|nr:dephospho-CoA kinase [Bacteroidales bacterium]
MKTILVTGGIGSGKSAVCSYLEEKGIPVYYSDDRTKSLYDNDPSLVGQLETMFGRGLRDADGNLDRKALADLVFGSPENLAKLESVVHPAVLRDFESWKESHRDSRAVVMESAIALERPVFERAFDYVVMVEAPWQTRLERACKRDGSDRESVMNRMAAQKFRQEKADVVVNNDLDLSVMKERVDLALKLLSL